MAYRHQRSAPLVRVQDLVTIHYYEIEPDFSFQGEQHPFWELVYVDDGEISTRDGEREEALRDGELLLHAPDVFHFARGDGEHYGHIFIISFTSRSKALKSLVGSKILLPPRLRTLISGIMREADAFYDMETDGLSPLPAGPKGGDQLIRLYLEELLIMLYRLQFDRLNSRGQPARPQSLTGEIILYLNNRVYSGLSIPELCRHLHYGKTTLSRIFREETGQSIMEYYRALKISEAKRLLREAELTVAQIAQLLSFDTPHYFSRVFRAHVGMTPSQFRGSRDSVQGV